MAVDTATAPAETPVVTPETQLSAAEQDALLGVASDNEAVSEVPASTNEATDESRSWSAEGDVD